MPPDNEDKIDSESNSRMQKMNSKTNDYHVKNKAENENGGLEASSEKTAETKIVDGNWV